MTFEDLFTRAESGNGKDTPLKDFASDAREYVEKYYETERFMPGDLVEWKPGMKNKMKPEYGEPIMVLAVFEPLRNEPDGSSYGCEPNDMRCILSKKDAGRMLVYSFDSHLFQKYTEKLN
jgi:hypothetical protein